ncbi:MAG: S8 family serine peptidase [Nocardioides sp.]
MHTSTSRSFVLIATGAISALCLAGLSIPSAQADPSTDGARFSAAKTQPTLINKISGDKAPTSALAETPAALRNITSSKKIPVMIKFDYDAVASYTGSLGAYAATSPSVTRKALDKNAAAIGRYTGYIKTREAEISAAVTKTVPSARITNSFRTVYGGVAAVIPGNTVRDLLKVPGVVAVQPDTVNHVLTDSSTDFINAPAAYRALRTRANAGAGMILGNLDSGVWPEHASFADNGNLPDYTGPAIPCEFGDNPVTEADDPFVCQNKLIGGRTFLDTYGAAQGDYAYPGTARDPGGHGTHTASTSAGNIVPDAQTLGPLLKVQGVAPGAQIIEYRVCGGAAGCYNSDSTAAVQQAVLDGVDVINYSISGGTNPLGDPVELAFLDAYNAGVFVATSAGNDGPGAGTANHLSPWTTTVAASTQTREFSSELTLTADNGDTFTMRGASITAGAGPAPVVLASASPYADELCQEQAPADTFAGKIVICRRGTNARVEKGYNVLQGGAAGMILYNAVLQDTETDNHWLPVVHLPEPGDLLTFMSSHTGVTGEWAAGAKHDGQGDVMAGFSSRGPVGSFIKPDITAPGVQIAAGNTLTPEEITDGPPNQPYMVIAGTSMSSPHIAGVALLIKAIHPDWDPGQIKSAMMTRAVTSVVKEDLTTPADPFDMGAGRVDVRRALQAPLTISETAENFASLTGLPTYTVDLNLPSINAPIMPGRLVTTRTLKNVTNRTQYVRTWAQTDAGTTIRVRPSRFSVAPGASKTVQITLTASGPVGEQQFGRLVFGTRTANLSLPVAFIPQQGNVSVEQACDPAAVAVGEETTCAVTVTNHSFLAQDVAATTRSTNDRARIVGADGAELTSPGAAASASLDGAQLGVPTVDAVAEGSPAGGYLDLGDFGFEPEAVGDEDIVNFDVPEFMFNGQAFTQVGVDSNGYLVVGGGDSGDNECCAPPSEASATRPNNLLAPFWSDLDGTNSDGVTLGVLGDADNSWLIVQWEVNVWGTADTRSFQTWIGLNGTQDISFTYASAMADPGGNLYAYGAENAAGAGDVVAELPDGTDQVITSTDPVPGGTLTYTVDLRGLRSGDGNVRTEVTATRVPGVTVVDTPVEVTP